ncbi:MULTISPECIES: DUF4352 domain-containing protein [Bacillus]|uniref:DUF4352 domain-containing protein n=1 Tax=Bacillus TaxID=1386 RepID=UPI0030FA908E
MKHKKIIFITLIIIICTLCTLKYNSINADYKNYKIVSKPILLNQEFITNDFKIVYINTQKNTININNDKYMEYRINIKMKNNTKKPMQYPSSKFYILAPNYKDNQSLYLYNKDKKKIPFHLQPNEEIEGFLIFKMPFDWNITNNTPVKIIFSESNVTKNQTIQYILDFKK